MAVTTHTKAAVLLGSPNQTLQVKGGRITLDMKSAPHVQAELTIAKPSAAVWAMLNPQLNKRVQITIGGDQSRTFNLHLRQRSLDNASDEASIRLSSNEGLMKDYSPDVEDRAPFALAASLRSVVNYVLGKAIPGAALAATPSNNAVMTPLWEITQLHTNPLIVNTYGYGLGAGSTDVARVMFGTAAAIRWTPTASVSNLIVSPAIDTFRVTPGKWYTFIASVRSSSPRTVQIAFNWFTGGKDDAVPMGLAYGPAQATLTSAFKTFVVTAKAPIGASSVQPFITTAGNDVGNDVHYANDVMVYEGDVQVPFFSGETADTSQYTYEWAESAHGSPSIRRPKYETATVQAFRWQTDQDALQFLSPLIQRAGFRLVCDEAQVWTLRSETYAAAGSTSIRHAINMTAASETLSRDTDTWFDARDTVYTWRDADGIEQTKTDTYAPAGYTKKTTLEVRAPYPGPGRSEYAVRRAQENAKEVTAEAVSNWTARAEQAVSVQFEGGAILTGTTRSVQFNLDNDEMTVDAIL